MSMNPPLPFNLYPSPHHGHPIGPLVHALFALDLPKNGHALPFQQPDTR